MEESTVFYFLNPVTKHDDQFSLTEECCRTMEGLCLQDRYWLVLVEQLNWPTETILTYTAAYCRITSTGPYSRSTNLYVYKLFIINVFLFIKYTSWTY
jgi:hypothetical protein